MVGAKSLSGGCDRPGHLPAGLRPRPDRRPVNWGEGGRSWRTSPTLNQRELCAQRLSPAAKQGLAVGLRVWTFYFSLVFLRKKGRWEAAVIGLWEGAACQREVQGRGLREKQ